MIQQQRCSSDDNQEWNLVVCDTSPSQYVNVYLSLKLIPLFYLYLHWICYCLYNISTCIIINIIHINFMCLKNIDKEDDNYGNKHFTFLNTQTLFPLLNFESQRETESCKSHLRVFSVCEKEYYFFSSRLLRERVCERIIYISSLLRREENFLSFSSFCWERKRDSSTFLLCLGGRELLSRSHHFCWEIERENENELSLPVCPALVWGAWRRRALPRGERRAWRWQQLGRR